MIAFTQLAEPQSSELRPKMQLSSIDKLAFAGSLIVFAFLYGIATQAFGWFPSPVLERAWDQAKAIGPVGALLSNDSEDGPGWLATRVYERSGVRIVAPQAMHPGLTLISSGWKSSNGSSPELRLISREGKVVHKWRVKPEELFPDTTDSPGGPLHTLGIGGNYLFPNGDMLVNVGYVGTLRLDACGKVKWYNTKYNFHHSIERASDGTFWLPGLKRSLPARSDAYPNGYPGLAGPLHRSLIVNISPDGEIIDTINVLDVLYTSGLHRHIAHAMLGWTEEEKFIGWADLIHMNDVEPLPDSIAVEYPQFETGDLLVSLRNPNVIFVLDPNSKEVKWHATHPFIDQHDPDFVGDGWIGVFDNNRDATSRGTMLGGSRIVLLQPHKDSVAVVFPTSKSDSLYTPIQGDWQMLRNGNLLITESQAGRVVEVNQEGETIWEWIHRPYNGESVPSVSKAARVPLQRDQVSSWPCSSGVRSNTEDVTR